MARTYQALQAEIAKLSKEAEALRAREVGDVIARIKQAITEYGITAADLFGTGAKSGPKPGAKRVAKKAGKAAKGERPVKYRDDAGNTWVGRGKRPDWVNAALAVGKKLEDFLVK